MTQAFSSVLQVPPEPYDLGRQEEKLRHADKTPRKQVAATKPPARHRPKHRGSRANPPPNGRAGNDKGDPGSRLPMG